MRKYLCVFLAVCYLSVFSGCARLHLHMFDEPGGEGTLAIPVNFTNDAEGDYVYKYTLLGTNGSVVNIPLSPTSDEMMYVTLPAGKYSFENLAISGKKDSSWNLNVEEKVVPLDPGYKLKIYRDEVTLFKAHVTVERKAVGYGETFISRWDITSLNKKQQEEYKEKVRVAGKTADGFVY